jgi:hypothetical protein
MTLLFLLLASNVTNPSQSSLPLSGAATDVWVLIALIVPGFLTFRIIYYLGIYETNFDQFTTTIYSLICSLIILIPLLTIYQLQSLDEIRKYIASPSFILMLFGFSILFGIGPGYILKKFRRIYQKAGPWERFGSIYLQKQITVFTEDNKEFIGWLKRISIGTSKRDIVLGDPFLVIRDPDGKPITLSLGKELLICDPSVRLVLRPRDKSS